MSATSSELVETAPHEFAANLNFNSDGLSIWFAAAKKVAECAGSLETEAAIDGERWSLKLYYQDSAIDPVDRTPAGTPIEFDTIREFRLHAEKKDGLGLKKMNAHIRPRWADQTANGVEIQINVPPSLANTDTDAVNINVKGSNIEHSRYLNLLNDFFAEIGINPAYLAEPHETSNIQDAARYVRIEKSASGPIHARDGPLVGLAHLLESDRRGYRKLVQNDDDEQGRNLPGYYHTTTIGSDRVQEVWPNHRLPKEFKHYYDKVALDRDDGDPLQHPKLEVAYQRSRWDETLRWDTNDLEQLRRELDEAIYSVLADAGLNIRESGPYVADEYWKPKDVSTTASVVDLDLATIRHEQENIVVRHLADGLSPIEQEALDTLVTDGGTVQPSDIAESHDRHLDSVYRALERMNDMVYREYGSVSLQSTYVAELVHDAIDQSKKSAKRATEAAARALDAADRGLDARTSAFVAWAAKYGLDWRDTGDGVEIDFGFVDQDDARRHVSRLLREGEKLWTQMNRDPAEYRIGRYRFTAEEIVGPKLRSIPESQQRERRHHSGEIWRVLTHRR